MYFPWNDYDELETKRRNTLQVFITGKCNLNCDGCFAKKISLDNISLAEYDDAIQTFKQKNGEQINLIGGEPFLHPDLLKMCELNFQNNLKTTIYTNGYFLNKLNDYCEQFNKCTVKIRVSVYSKNGATKSILSLAKTENFNLLNIPIEICFMVSKTTTVLELLESAQIAEQKLNCKVFFISSIRELDNANCEFFDDTAITMNVLDYKKLVHEFLQKYNGNMEIHISKRGVFESTKTLADNKCRFSNYFIGGKIIQCPFDIVNNKFQNNYEFGKRHCGQNNTCLMSKIIVVRKIK